MYVGVGVYIGNSIHKCGYIFMIKLIYNNVYLQILHVIKYCIDRYNHMINPDTNILNNTAIVNEESDIELSILDTEVMKAINTPKKGKSPGIDNISSYFNKTRR